MPSRYHNTDDPARILIVEDERVPAEFLKRFIRKQGHEVVGVCDTAEAAIETAVETRPDIIFMDILLKGSLTGAEAALRIADRIETRIIFLTAHSDPEMIEYAREAGAVNYLVKPYRDDQILAALQLALGAEAVPARRNILHLKNGCYYNRDQQQLFCHGREVHLSGKVFRLFALLCEEPIRTVSIEEIARHIYGEPKETSTIRTLMHRLRSTIGEDMVENVSGVGYRVEVEGDW